MEPPPAGAPDAPRRALLDGLGCAVLGAGLGVQSSSIARLASRVGLGTPEDARIFGAVFALLAILGFVALGRSLRLRGPKALGASALVAALVGIADLSVIAGITSPRGFRALCQRFGTDASLAGTPLVDAAAALLAFLLPGLAVGAVLYASLARRRVLPLLLGAALGGIAGRWLLATPLGSDGSAGLVPVGAATTGLGVALLWFASASKAFRLPLAPFAAVLAALAIFVPTTPVPVRIPWQRFPVQPLAVFETPDGQWTVDTREGLVRAVLQQRAVSPSTEELALESACLSRTFEAAYPGERPSRLRVLCFGLVTPERAALLRREGVTEIAATARWWRSMDELEPHFAQRDETQETAGVRVVAPNDSAVYDLVLTFPVGAYLASGFDLSLVRARSEPTIAWLAPDRPLPSRARSERHLLASAGVERFAVALLWDLGTEGESSASPIGYRRPGWLEWMRSRPDDRARRAWAVYADALATDPEASAFERGLSTLAALQRASSPFETALERIELDRGALAQLFDPPAEAPRPFQRGVLEGAARALEAQREVPWAFELLAPMASRFAPWPALERGLAWAESEELEFDAAARRLAPLASGPAADLATVRAFAKASVHAGRPTDATAALRPWSDALPEHRALKTQLADALVAADDPEGRRLAAELLRDDPSNPELFGLAKGIRGMLRIGIPVATDLDPAASNERNP